MVDGNIVGNL